MRCYTNVTISQGLTQNGGLFQKATIALPLRGSAWQYIRLFYDISQHRKKNATRTKDVNAKIQGGYIGPDVIISILCQDSLSRTFPDVCGSFERGGRRGCVGGRSLSPGGCSRPSRLHNFPDRF